MSDGIFDPKLFELFNKLTAALVRFTPEHFKTIHCTITEGKESGQRALFYNISCPEFPNEGTTNVDASVHDATTSKRLDVDHDAPPRGSAPKKGLSDIRRPEQS